MFAMMPKCSMKSTERRRDGFLGYLGKLCFAALLASAFIPLQAHAEVNYKVDYASSGSTLTISGSGQIGRITSDLVADYQCNQITTIIIEEGVTGVATNVYGAFGRLTNATSISLPSSFTYIGDNAFQSCSSLKSITIPNGVTTIGKNAFQYCYSLENVKLGSNTKALGDYAFADCPKLADFTFNEGLESIGKYAFAQFGSDKGGAALKDVTIPASVKTIGDRAFSGLKQLESVTILGNAQLGDSSFINCTALKSVKMDSVESVSKYAFQGCTKLSSVSMSKVKTIGASAFYGCTSISSLELPASLTSIGSQAFSSCTSLASISFAGSAPSCSGSIAGSSTKIVYPAENASWTKDVRKTIASDPNNMYMRKSDGTLQKAPYISPFKTVTVPYGDSGFESISPNSPNNSICFDFALTKEQIVQITLSYTLPCYHGSYIINVRDQEGFTLFDALTIRTSQELVERGTEVLRDRLDAGEYHVEVIYNQSHKSQTGYFGVRVGEPTQWSSSPARGTQQMYRLYNPNSGEHFYTASAGEKNMLVGVGWNYEGIGWTAPATSKSPVYRLYNANAGDHHYTMSAGERDSLVRVGWKYEGIGWYSDDAKGVALYRQYNPNAKAGSHNYTTSQAEHNQLVSIGWHGEGIGWYGCK